LRTGGENWRTARQDSGKNRAKTGKVRWHRHGKGLETRHEVLARDVHLPYDVQRRCQERNREPMSAPFVVRFSPSSLDAARASQGTTPANDDQRRSKTLPGPHGDGAASNPGKDRDRPSNTPSAADTLEPKWASAIDAATD
jgi:hypothetical protein